jgi:hypothetical protein
MKKHHLHLIYLPFLQENFQSEKSEEEYKKYEKSKEEYKKFQPLN